MFRCSFFAESCLLPLGYLSPGFKLVSEALYQILSTLWLDCNGGITVHWGGVVSAIECFSKNNLVRDDCLLLNVVESCFLEFLVPGHPLLPCLPLALGPPVWLCPHSLYLVIGLCPESVWVSWGLGLFFFSLFVVRDQTQDPTYQISQRE